MLFVNPQNQAVVTDASTMAEVPYFISLDEALEISKRVRLDIRHELVSLDEAHGRILSDDVISKVDDPAFDNSAMDGFAMKHEDTLSPPTSLEIVGEVQASSHDSLPLIKNGQAARIMTGAPIPPGADSILQIERCEVSDDRVTILEESKPGFIRKQAENLKSGEPNLFAGQSLTPESIGLCATMGHAQVMVQRPLKVAIISTGDELIPPGEELKPGEIYESNSFGLAGLVRMMGHHPIRMESMADDIEKLRISFNEAAQYCDLILTSGGVSMGEYDLVRKIMEEEGDMHFWRVKIRPGSPPLFGLWNNTPIFGLPGNPVSSHIVFRMLVAPWLRDVTGAEGPVEQKIRVKLATKVKSTKDCLTLRRISIEFGEEGFIGHQKVHQGSGNLASMAHSDALTVLQPGQSAEPGDWIDALLI